MNPLAICMLTLDTGANWYHYIRWGFEHSKPELTNEGFRVISKTDPRYWIELKEDARGRIFAYAHEPTCTFRGQVMRGTVISFYNEIVDALLAA